MSVAADSLCNDLPVDICSDGKTDGGPSCVRDTGQVRKTRETHEKPAAHVGGFRAHGCHKRSEFSSAKIKVSGVVVILGTAVSHIEHRAEIDNNGYHNTDMFSCHLLPIPFTIYCKIVS